MTKSASGAAARAHLGEERFRSRIDGTQPDGRRHDSEYGIDLGFARCRKHLRAPISKVNTKEDEAIELMYINCPSIVQRSG